MNDKREMFTVLPGGKGRAKGPGDGATWEPIVPVPQDAPAPPGRHPAKGEPSASWTYLDGRGQLLGFTWRIDDRSGGKEFVYLTFCHIPCSGARAWRFKAWAVPRPLYGLDRLAKRPGAPVVLCEGEKAANAAGELLPQHVAIASPGGSGAAGKADWRVLARRNVVIWPDADAAGKSYADAAAQAILGAGAARVCIATPPEDVAAGWDAADALAEGWSPERAAQLLSQAVAISGGREAIAADAAATTGGGGRRRVPQRDNILGMLDDGALWHDESGEVFATLAINSHAEHWPLRSREVKRWISARYYEQESGAIGGQALEDALRVMEAIGAERGPCYQTFRRVGELGGKLYIDLSDRAWRAVEIGPDGWHVTDRPPVKFLRSSAMRPLPEPLAGEPIENLRGFVNLPDDKAFMLVVGWLVHAMRPSGPYAILTVSGEQGSGKSNLARVMRALTDPSLLSIRAVPREESDLMVAADNTHVLAFDNLSSVPAWLADGLCRIATGGGFGARKKYSDRDESVLSVKRPIILNGIPNLSDRADLADRSLSVHLSAIPDDERRSEDEFWQGFAAVVPGVLGALCDGLSSGLRHLAETRIERLPRMADFARWVEACAPGLGWEPGEFLEAYAGNRRDIADLAFEADPLAVAINAMMAEQADPWWEGSAKDLLAKVNGVVDETVRKSKYWPGSPSAMGSRFTRAMPLLRQAGFDVSRHHSGTRTIRIVRRQGPAAPAGDGQ